MPKKKGIQPTKRLWAHSSDDDPPENVIPMKHEIMEQNNSLLETSTDSVREIPSPPEVPDRLEIPDSLETPKTQQKSVSKSKNKGKKSTAFKETFNIFKKKITKRKSTKNHATNTNKSPTANQVLLMGSILANQPPPTTPSQIQSKPKKTKFVTTPDIPKTAEESTARSKHI